MTMPNNEQPNEPGNPRDRDRENGDPLGKGQYILTAKDAGWRSPGFFISPATFVTIDPPEPKKRRPSP
jgi:hypothetical protein